MEIFGISKTVSTDMNIFVMNAKLTFSEMKNYGEK